MYPHGFNFDSLQIVIKVLLRFRFIYFVLTKFYKEDLFVSLKRDGATLLPTVKNGLEKKGRLFIHRLYVFARKGLYPKRLIIEVILPISIRAQTITVEALVFCKRPVRFTYNLSFIH